MTVNRCGYARCAAPLDPDGPSLYFCGETCQANWTQAQRRARPLDPAGAEPLPVEPVRGATPTFVVVDEMPRPASAPLPPRSTAMAAVVAEVLELRRRILGGSRG